MAIRAEIQAIIDQIKNGTLTEVKLDAVSLVAVDEHTKSNMLQEDEVAALADALLSPNCKVTELDLMGNKEKTIADKISKALRHKNSMITTLNLMYCEIGVEGASLLAPALAASKCLANVFLVGNKLGDEGAKIIANALKSSENVVSDICLNKNNIGNEGAKALASVLEHDTCRVLEIGFHENEIGDEGAKALASALTHKNCRVKKIDISSNKFGEQGAIAFAEAIKLKKELNNVDMRWNEIGMAGRNALDAAGLEFTTTEIKKNNNLHNVINFASKHKVACVLAGVAACTIVMCYNKPEIVTNAKEMFAKLFENVSGFAMGK